MSEPDGIPGFIIKDSAEILAVPLTTMFNIVQITIFQQFREKLKYFLIENYRVSNRIFPKCLR